MKKQLKVEYRKSLEYLYPDLAKQWHPTKNGMLKPSNFTCHSSKIVWWYLPYDDPKTGKHFDFEWKSRISHRVDGRGCPFLSGKAVWSGFNDLATLRPDLAVEWHSTKNGNLTPSMITIYSGRKCWWQIKYYSEKHQKWFNFEWKAKVSSRVNGSRCPYLTGKMVFTGFNDLGSNYPELLKEWDWNKNKSINPYKVACASMKEVWWVCQKCGYCWKTPIEYRTVSGRGCLRCSRAQFCSYPEKALCFYLSKLDKSIINTYLCDGLEIDIYSDNLKIGIEYDGYYFHSNRVNKDKSKNKKCINAGIKLIRVRENLTGLNDTSIDILYNTNTQSLDEIIYRVAKIIYSKEEADKLDINTNRDKQIIQELPNRKLEINEMSKRMFEELDERMNEAKAENDKLIEEAIKQRNL